MKFVLVLLFLLVSPFLLSLVSARSVSVDVTVTVQTEAEADNEAYTDPQAAENNLPESLPFIPDSSVEPDQLTSSYLSVHHPDIPEELHSLIEGFVDDSSELNDALDMEAAQKEEQFYETAKEAGVGLAALKSMRLPQLVHMLSEADQASIKCRGFLTTNSKQYYYDGLCLPTQLCDEGTPLNDTDPATQTAPCSFNRFATQCCLTKADKGEILPRTDKEWIEKYQRYARSFGKRHSVRVIKQRMEEFKRSYTMIHEHNHGSPLVKYWTMKVTHLADVFDSELNGAVFERKRRLGLFSAIGNMFRSRKSKGEQPSESVSAAGRKLLQKKVKPAPKPARTPAPAPVPASVDVSKYPTCRISGMKNNGYCMPFDDCNTWGGVASGWDPCQAVGIQRTHCCAAKADVQQKNTEPWFEPWVPEPTKDWRISGLMTPIKNQGGCGSCFDFAATAALESWAAIRGLTTTKKLEAFSSQRYLSCTNNNYCPTGGSVSSVLAFYATQGACSEESFPYEAINGTYKAFGNPKCSTCTKVMEPWIKLPPDAKPAPGANRGVRRLANEEEMEQVISKEGPVAFGMSTGHGLKIFDDGIYVPETCKSPPGAGPSGHAMVAVGFGRDGKTGLDYWIVRNSWGKSFGVNGYFRIVKGRNICDLGTSGSYVPDFDFDKPGPSCPVTKSGKTATCYTVGYCKTLGTDFVALPRKECPSGQTCCVPWDMKRQADATNDLLPASWAAQP